LFDHACQERITTAGITVEKDSKASKDKHQNWATAGGTFLWVNYLESCKDRRFSHHSSGECWWFVYKILSDSSRWQVDCCRSNGDFARVFPDYV